INLDDYTNISIIGREQTKFSSKSMLLNAAAGKKSSSYNMLHFDDTSIDFINYNDANYNKINLVHITPKISFTSEHIQTEVIDKVPMQEKSKNLSCHTKRINSEREEQ